MLLHGDELGRTQHGNNNTYAQDTEISWVHWDERRPAAGRVHRRRRPAARTSHPTFRRKRFFTGTHGAHRRDGERLTDIVWLHLDGRPDGGRRLGARLRRRSACSSTATASPATTPAASTIIDDHFLLYFNADGPAEVTLPPEEYADAWDVVIDTGGVGRRRPTHRRPGATFRPRRPAASSCSASTPSPRPSPDHSVAASRRRARSTGTVDRRDAALSGCDADRRSQSTYRLQITADFDLFEAARRLPYLHDLGVDWVYLSPLLAAEPGSNHGYDVVAHDHDRPRARRRGGAGRAVGRGAAARAWACWSTSCPTTSASPRRARTPWWWDVLTARPRVRARGRVRHRLGRRRRPDPDPGPRRRRRWTTVRSRTSRSSTASCATTTTASRSRPAPATGRPHAVHDRSTTSWSTGDAADDELNYRRFFAVNTLAGVRVEDPEVFDETHVEIRRWFDEGLVDGLRVDHPDGLRDPQRLPRRPRRADRRRLRAGREDPRARRAAAGRRGRPPGTTGYDALGAHRPGAHRPGRPGAARRARDPAARRARSTGRR